MGWVCAWLLLTQPQCLALSFVCETKVPSSCSGLCQVSHPFSLECSSGPGCPSKALAHSAPVYSHLNIFKPECYLWQLQMYLFPLVSPLLEQVGVPRQDLHSFLIMLGPRPAPVTALRKTWKIMGEEIGRKELAVSSSTQKVKAQDEAGQSPASEVGDDKICQKYEVLGKSSKGV